MRQFEDIDRQKKKERIKLGDNPANLTTDVLQRLEAAVKGSLKDGYIPCPTGWKIAKDMGIPKMAVGAMMDRLGVRVTDCQIGFFRVDKTPYEGVKKEEPSDEVVKRLKELEEAGELNCTAVFALAHSLRTTPMTISEAANVLGMKIRGCQLGCF